MTDPVQTTADAAISAGIAISNKLTWVSGGIGVAVSFWDSLPTGMAISVVGIVLGLGVNILFRWLGHRRDAKHKAEEMEMRRIEHDAKMQHYRVTPDSDQVPLS